MISRMISSRGRSVVIQTAAQVPDALNTEVLHFADARTVKAYIADQGEESQWDHDLPSGRRTITAYIEGDDPVTTEDRLKIDSVIFQVQSVTRPGFRSIDSLGHTAVVATSDPKVAET